MLVVMIPSISGVKHGARGRGALAEDALDEERHVDDRPEHRRADRERGDGRSGERPLIEEVERQDRLFRPALPEDEGGREHRSRDEEADDDR